jgi:trimeric autotransporter adhesin
MTTGSYNTALGGGALSANTTGPANTAVGYNAMGTGTGSNGNNVAVGKDALAVNTAGNNTAVGTQALTSNTTGADNVAVGLYALGTNTTASLNTAVGRSSLHLHTTGSNNTAVGYQAGYAITTGTYNNILGSLDTTLTTGSYNMLLGRFAYVQSSATSYALVVNTDNTARTDKGTNTGYIFTGGSVYQGNNSASWATVSDERLKKNIVDNNDGLDKINQIQIRNFEYRPASEVTDLPETQAVDKEGTQLGVIAQEIQQVLPDMVKEESTGVLRVDTDNMTWYLVNAVKELSAKVEALQTEVNLLKGK